jgi:hypothetical protein
VRQLLATIVIAVTVRLFFLLASIKFVTLREGSEPPPIVRFADDEIRKWRR